MCEILMTINVMTTVLKQVFKKHNLLHFVLKLWVEFKTR